MPGRLELRHEFGLSIRADFRAHLVDPKLAGDRLRNTSSVARDQQGA